MSFRNSLGLGLVSATLCSACIFSIEGYDSSDDWVAHKATAARAQKYVGSGDVELRSFNVDEFDQVAVNDAMTVTIAVGESPSVEVSCDDNLLDFIRVETRASKLKLSFEPGSYDFKEPVLVRIGTPSLTAVDINSTGSVEVEGLNGGRFDVDLDGTGSVLASGHVRTLVVDIDGTGSANLRRLSADLVDIEIDGTGNAQVLVNERLNVEIDGTGNVTYVGDPERVRSEVNGTGHVMDGN